MTFDPLNFFLGKNENGNIVFTRSHRKKIASPTKKIAKHFFFTFGANVQKRYYHFRFFQQNVRHPQKAYYHFFFY